MTFLMPPLYTPIDTTDDRRRPAHTITKEVPGRLIALGAALDFVDATSDRWAASNTELFLSQQGTSDGSIWVAEDEPDAPARWITELRALTTCSFAEIARLVGVERRTMYFWLEGRPISEENRGRLLDVLTQARRLKTNSPAETAGRLVAALGGGQQAARQIGRVERFQPHEDEPSPRRPSFDVATLLSTGGYLGEDVGGEDDQA